jgi:dipeptidyl aminopeptidase/acylaminoacyl peptidase
MKMINLVTIIFLLALSSLLPIPPQQAERVRAMTVYAPAWSPDDCFISFEAKVNDKWVVMLIGVDGTGLRRLTDESVNSHSASWSPDGRSLVFVSERSSGMTTTNGAYKSSKRDHRGENHYAAG